MTTYLLKAPVIQRHQTRKRDGFVHVDNAVLRVQTINENTFLIDVGGHSTRLHAIAHGDVVHVQLNGRACLIERVDPTLSGVSGTSESGGGAHAPMPGVVVSLLTKPGSTVKKGTALLVIESMKLQMTIDAYQDGVLEELPFAEGQTFQRGAVLARIRSENMEGESA